MMRIALDWCHVQAGTADHLLEYPNTKIDYIERCWIMAIRDFLRTYKNRMKFAAHSHPVTLCDKDEFIMDALRIRGECSPNELQRLNACRMHLRVSRLSEIASADGTSLRNESIQGKDSAIHLSKTKWPRQARPLKSDWTFWRRKLRAVFSRDGSSTVLYTPLGEWQSSLDVRELAHSYVRYPGKLFAGYPTGHMRSFR
jgi:hypothetical protein